MAALAAHRWISGPWFFRDDRMYLLPGDSPMGYRLPLDALPWVSEADYPWQFDQDPFAARSPLPTGAQLRAQLPGLAGQGAEPGQAAEFRASTAAYPAPGSAAAARAGKLAGARPGAGPGGKARCTSI